MRRLLFTCILICTVSVGLLFAQSSKDAAQTPEEFDKKLGLQTGTVTLPGGIATIRVPKEFRFIGLEGSRRVLTEAWGNPPGSADGVLGMLIPAGVSPLDEKSWGVVISFDDDGYVNDEDAASLDYTKLLEELRKGAAASNEEREREGFATVELVGWAEPPRYDKAAHKLYWARELSFADQETHTLNYNIRILGRRGVLVLNAVSDMDDLANIRAQSPALLAAVDFNEGHRYTDYLPGEKATAYGITGLILGAAAAKAGFFKVLLVGILALKKFIIVGVVALVAILKKFFGGTEQGSTVPPPIQ
jgi:uncharacterized membrane-anchored protein